MNLLITTAGKLYKTPDGVYFSKIVYGYNFFKVYLSVFDSITLFSQVKSVEFDKVVGMLKVSGDRLSVVELPLTKGIIDFLKKISHTKKVIKENISYCDCAVLRPPDQVSYYIMRLLQKQGKKVAIEITTNVWTYLAPRNSNTPFRFILRLLWTYQQKKSCKKADYVSYVASFLRDKYPPKLLKNSMIFTDVGLDKKYYSYDIRQYSEPLETINLIHIAASINNDAKGYTELIYAFAKIRKDYTNATLTLIGDGKLSLASQKLIDYYELSDSITMTGKISDRDLLFEYLRKSDIFVFPSYSEGLPRSLLEAMVNGCVCITTDLPGCKEVLDYDVLVPVKDADALYKKITEYLSDYKKMNMQKKRNYNKSFEFSEEIIWEKRIDFYSQLK